MKNVTLKAFVLATALAATGAIGAEAGPPFERTQFDRIRPNIPEKAVSRPASSGASITTSSGRLASGVWANDHSFIAPPG